MRYLLLVAIFPVLLSSCHNYSRQELEAWDRSVDVLDQNSGLLRRVTMDKLEEIKERLSDWRLEEKAVQWYPLADTVKQSTDSLLSFADNLLADLERKIFPRGSGHDPEKFRNSEIVRRLFFSEKKGALLFEKLRHYQNRVTNLHPEFAKIMPNLQLHAFNGFDSSAMDPDEFTRLNFEGIPAIQAVSALYQLKSNIVAIENELITFCYYSTQSRSENFTLFQAIAVLDKPYVRANETIELISGVGDFSNRSRPVLTVNGKKFNPGENNVMRYRFKAPGRPGKYTLPVRINYTAPDGTADVLEKTMEYTVINDTTAKLQ